MFQYAPRGLDEGIISTEWVGGFANAKFTRDIALGDFGSNVISSVGAAPAIEWEFASAGGARDIWVQYASFSERSARLLVNGVEVAANALWETTGGWGEEEQTFSFQARVNLETGLNAVRLEAAGAFPHLRSLSVCFPGDDERPGVQERYRRARELAEVDTAIGLRSADFTALPGFIEALRARGLTPTAIESVFKQYLGAISLGQNKLNVLNGFGGPFNGQRLRLRIVNDIMEAVPFSAFVETGAYLGTTTEHFARMGLPVASCEAVLNNFVIAASRLCRYTNVDLHLADSRSFLKTIKQTRPELYKRPLIYLDAHWFDDLPLPDEINFISENIEEYLIIVDDFEVADSKYFFDVYSNGNELTFKYLFPKLNFDNDITLMVPRNASTEETGPRKGTLFVAPTKFYREKLNHIDRLKVVDPKPWL